MGIVLNESLQKATDAIFAYTLGIYTADWDTAVSGFAELVEVIYTTEGMIPVKMRKQELKAFLQELHEIPDSRVHSSISQVFESPLNPSEFFAYYSIRQFKEHPGLYDKSKAFGFFSFTIRNDVVVSLKINVSALEGESSVLA